MRMTIQHTMHGRTCAAICALSLLIGGAWSAQPAHAVVELNITEGNIQPLPIAVTQFTTDGSVPPEVAREVSGVVANDLRALRPVRADRPSRLHRADARHRAAPRFDDWRLINAQALVDRRVGSRRRPAQRRVPAVGRVRRQQMAGEQFYHRGRRLAPHRATSSPTRSTSASPARRAISTRASSSSTRPARKDKRIKRLAIMDQDGANSGS